MEMKANINISQNLPDTFIRRVQLTFKEQGRVWLKELDQLIAACAQKWQLTDITPVAGLSYNLVCTASCPHYGRIILKLCAPNAEHEKEAAVLKYYQGNGICRLYDYDQKLGAMLIERMETMDDLRSVDNFMERIQIAAQITYKMPIRADAAMHSTFPTYEDWIKKAFHLIKHSPLTTLAFSCYVLRAEELLAELAAEKRPPMLLHGDLHHMNILRNKGAFTAIDPHGVIGALPQNAARFIENELAEKLSSSLLS